MKQTTLDLNGPILSFVQNPVGVATTGVISGTGSGIATFIGIATASFNTIGTVTNSASNTGFITYRWYEVGVGALSDSTYVTGTATTTLTLLRLITPTDNQKRFYVQADYVPSAYGLPGVAVTVGSARSTGNAINEPLDSTVGILTVSPLIQINNQPIDQQTVINADAFFTVDASLTDSFFGSALSYQWSVNGVDVTDGVITTTSTTSTTTPTPQEFNYTSNTTVSIPASATDIEVIVAGASGANSSGIVGGRGRVGKFTYASGTARTLTLEIGTRGSSATGGSSGGNGGVVGVPGLVNPTAGGGGGGATGVYDNVLGRYVIVAAGGGGAGGGTNISAGSSGGTGGSFSSTDTISIDRGTDGGSGSTAGGGGGGGGGSPAGAGGAGGGGVGAGGAGGAAGSSKYYGANSPITFNTEWTNEGDGYVNLKYTAVSTTQRTITKNTTIIGSNTPRLIIKSDGIGIQTVRCKITNPDAPNSPVYTNTVYFATVSGDQQYNLNFENINSSSSATLTTVNLYNNSVIIGGENPIGISAPKGVYLSRVTPLSFYAPDKDIEVTVELHGNYGADSGSNKGGAGGKSIIKFTMKKNEEYVLTSLDADPAGIFLYRKASLIAGVGNGGNASTSGNGGDGGGVNVGGAAGGGRGGGSGGILYAAGTLPSSGGVAGSLGGSIPTNSNDSAATVPDGGRTLACPRGNQSVPPCSNLGTTKFLWAQSTPVPNTAEIDRGFKQGYGLRDTPGGRGGGGNGGGGPTGGAGGTSGGGGGGGGYTDGSVTVVETQQGGSQYTTATVVIRSIISSGDFYIDSSGRILILSAATPQKNPTTLIKTTSKVLPNTDSCIDDARWRNFLDLSSTGDYRLTITTNSTTEQFASITKATSFNLNKLLGSNQQGLSISLTDWKVFESKSSDYILLAWDEDEGFNASGSDYSGIVWDINNKNYGFYNESNNKPFIGTSGIRTSTCCWWILPPGVPDF